MKNDKKVLIVGSSAKDYALAKKLIQCGCEVFVAPGNRRIKDVAKCVDIREDNVNELLKFALDNEVNLTVVTSEKAIKADIADVFQANGQLIFSPYANSAEFALSRSSAKKLLYKLHIPTPHFGIYDKQQTAIDSLKKTPMPQVIHADKKNKLGDRLVCTTYSIAKTFVEDLFAKGEEKVILEDYVYGHEFTFYVVTDGYHAIPLTAVANYKLSDDGDGGILTDGIGAYTPDYKISKEIETNIMRHVVTRILSSLEEKGTPYLGILGIEMVLDGDKFVTLSFKPFLSDHDCSAVLNIIDEDLFALFTACAVGSFEDYKNITISDSASVSCVVSSRIEGESIKGLDLVESEIVPFDLNKNKYLEYETVIGKNLVLTKTASTLTRARKYLYEDLSMINFDGIKYRKDICEDVENY